MGPWGAVVLSASVALCCSQGCASDGEGADPSPPTASTAPSLPATPSVDDLGASLGCEVEVVEIRDRLPFGTETADCRAGEQLVARLHAFPAEAAAEVRSFFSDRYPANPRPCPDGEAQQVPWVVLADTWAAVAPTRPGAETIATDLDGAVLVDFSADGPPVSYTYPADGFCPVV